MKLRAIAAVLMTLAMSATSAFAGPNGSIDIFNVAINPDASAGAVDFGACQAQATTVFGVLGKFAIAIYARQAGTSAAGISGAEFYVAGLEPADLPTGWTKTFIPAAGVLVVGDIDDPHLGGPNGTDVIRRANVTWTVDGPADPDCQVTSLTFLGRIECQSAFGTPVIAGTRRIRILAGNPPSNPTRDCPGLVFCNFPIFDAVCVTGGQYILNPAPPNTCSVGVEQKTWGGVKGLYR
jgi:hypothetical protein